MNKYIIYELEQLEKLTGYSLTHIKNDINDVYNKLEEKHKEIERLNKEKDDLDDCNRHLHNELKKKDNIINELEKYFAKPNKFIERPERMKILDKLKELKEDK